MSSESFQLFSSSFVPGFQLFYALALACFFRPFLPQPRIQGLAIVSLAYLAAFFLCNGFPVPRGALGPLLLALTVGLSKPVGIARPLAFFLTLLYLSAKISAGLVAESLYFLAEQLFPFHPEPIEGVYLRAAWLITAFFLSHLSLFSLLLWLLARQLKRRRLSLHRRELCYMSLIPAASILFGQMVSSLLLEVKDGVLLQLYERHPAFLGVVPALALLFSLGSLLAISFRQSLEALLEERESSFVQRQQAAAIRDRIQEVEEFYTRVREMKHQLRGHLTAIRGLAQRGEYRQAEQYIARMDESMSGFERTLQTGSAVTDVIVDSLRRQCQEQGIGFYSEFHYPSGGRYDAFDLGIILHNLLQNALEACQNLAGERYISLAGRRQGRFFLIEVQNPFAGQLVLGENGLPSTTKEDALLHGLGLSQVRREAEKYTGELELKTDGQIFCATVLLQEQGKQNSNTGKEEWKR